MIKPNTDYKIDLLQSNSVWEKKTKLRRVLWQCLVKTIYHLIPTKRLYHLRIWMLRAMGATIGRDCLILPRVNILMPWNLVLGDVVVLSHDVCILNFAKVTVKSMSVISQGVHLCTGTHDYEHPHFPLTYEPIVIESENWVASGAFIAPGVTLGRGCVVGAYSVVIKDMPAWMVCAGNPCKPIKRRDIKPTAEPTHDTV